MLLAVSTWAVSGQDHLRQGQDGHGAQAGGSATARATESGGAGAGSASGGANGKGPGGSATGDSSQEEKGAADPDETRQAAIILRAAGWRVAAVTATTPLAVAWQQLSLFPAGISAPLVQPSAAPAQGAAG
jgi:hypothetical protein